MTTQTKSLYDRLGGLDAINALTESWVARVGGDDRANRKFARTDIPRLKKEVADQLCEATGGPCAYTGRSMRDTHAGMKTTVSLIAAAVAVPTLPRLRGVGASALSGRRAPR